MIGLVAFGCFLFNYFGVNILITGLHSYAGV
jgi:ABC-type transport system involved in cytochrome c biogenesis permease subunit